ncbi:MAG: sulfotransferase [Gammaproteobacteria bacterium]|nr:sulfotransferase [Gammaproteobacteria bacterium]
MTCYFVGGVNRSGTTLVQGLLCSDPTTNPLIHEASYLRSVAEAYAFGKQQFHDHNEHYFDSVEELRRFTAAWAEAFVDRVRQRYPGTEHVVLKHPPLTPRFPDLHELLDDVRLVVVVRDPRDVAASLVRVGERLRRQGRSEGRSLPRDMDRLAQYYMRCYQPALGHSDPQYQRRLTLVRYEDLVADPSAAVARLGEATGLRLDAFDPEAAWPRDAIDHEAARAEGNAWSSELYGRGVSTGRVGHYVHVLSPDEIAALESACAGPLATFGYAAARR